MAMLAVMAVMPQPAFSETRGNGSLTVDMTISPDPVVVGDDVTIAILLTSTVNVTLNIDYFIYAGWSDRIAAGSMQIQPGANVSLTAQWHADEAGTWPVGINVTDNATGNVLLVHYRDVVVKGDGAGRLSADVSLSPATVHVNDNVTVRVKLCNTGYSMLYDIHYVLYAGFGNYIANGNVPRLWPAATCQSVPGGGVELNAHWTPNAPGTYKVGINASDSNGTASVVSFINVSVEYSETVIISLSPSSIRTVPGTSFNVTVAMRYIGGLDSMMFRLERPSLETGWSIDLPNGSIQLQEGWNTTRGIIISVPAGATGGNHSITFILRQEAIYGNLSAEAQLVVFVDTAPNSTLADLSVAATDIYLSPDPTEGTPCTLRAIIGNKGSIQGTGTVFISDINGTAIGQQDVSLDPGKTVGLSFSWTPMAGNHTVEVTVRTLSGGNMDMGNDLATRTFYISPGTGTPPPLVPRLVLVIDREDVSIPPGGSILLTVHIICQNAPAPAVMLGTSVSEGLPIQIEVLSPPPALRPGDNWTSQLRIRAPGTLGNASRSGTLQVTVSGAGAAGETRAIAVKIAEVVPVKSEVSMVAIGAVAVVSVIVVAAVAVGGTEIGLVALLALILPLYSKIRREEVLDQFTRGKIQGYITAYPGEHYNSIKAQLGMNNGSLAYHLRVLEREGYVTSVRDGMYRRYYPKETALPRKKGQFSQMQQMIIEQVRSQPGISQDGLAQTMKVSNQVIYYHVRNLMAAGAIRLEKAGKETHCYLAGFDDS